MKKINQQEALRGYNGQPIINGTRYTRASTLAKILSSTDGLMSWSNRVTALGVARNEDIAEQLKEKDLKKDKKEIDTIIETVKTTSGAYEGRDTGTAIHEVTELLDYNENIDDSLYSEQNIKDAQAYVAAVKSLNMTPEAAECFVVNKTVKTAGTFDRLVSHDIGYVITDIKTGKEDDPEYAIRYNSLPWAIQLAVYANSTPWSGSFLRWEDWGFSQPSTSYGVIWYIPRGFGKCYPITIDIQAGWEAAKTAHQVSQLRKSNFSLKIHPEIEIGKPTLFN